MKRSPTALLTIAAFGYAFLYLPLVSVVIYSFNDSRLVTLWGGFSLRWYRSLLESEDILSSALLSLEIAVASATLATALGTLVGLALNRLRRFRGRQEGEPEVIGAGGGRACQSSTHRVLVELCRQHLVVCVCVCVCARAIFTYVDKMRTHAHTHAHATGGSGAYLSD